MHLSLWQKTKCLKIRDSEGEAVLRMRLVQRLGELVQTAACTSRTRSGESKAAFIKACAAVELIAQALFGDAPERQHAGPAPSTSAFILESARLIQTVTRAADFGAKVFADEERRSIDKIRAMIEDAVSADPADLTQIKYRLDRLVHTWLVVSDI